MYLIVGLGNPGENYKNTRHNAGFLFVDRLVAASEFSLDRKKEVEVARKNDIIFVKPQTFMNDSGRAVRKMVDFYKLKTEEVIIVHDDLDIAFGEYKIQKEKGPKVHNGVLSVEQCLGGTNFWRVRVGIDNRQPGISYGTGADYVLSLMSREELGELEKLFEEIVSELREVMDIDLKN